LNIPETTVKYSTVKCSSVPHKPERASLDVSRGRASGLAELNRNRTERNKS
jgi:hypothetical protein